MENEKDILIIMADDDHDDIMLTQKALQKSGLLNPLVAVNDGEELLDYLLHRGKYTDTKKYPLPGIILLDLNMPKKDGRETLQEIKSHAELKSIPVVIFTTSKAEEDIYKSYELGVNSFVTKPVKFEELVKVIASLGGYWFKIVQLPANKRSPINN
ncbi:response regulator [soil metagenome]